MDQPRQTSTASQPPETQSQSSDSAPKPAVLSQIQPPNPIPSSIPSIPSSPTPPSPSINPNPNPSQYTRPVTSVVRPPPPTYSSRPWQQQQQHSSYTPASSSSSPLPKGGMAIGVPASSIPISSPTPSPSAFSGSFGPQYSGLGRGTVATNVPQVRMMQGATQGIGVMGTLNSGSQLRPNHQVARPSQSSIRPNSSPNTFQGHHNNLMRPSTPVSSPSVQSTSAAHTINQPWQPSSSPSPQGKPPLPPPSYRPLVNTPSMQQRTHVPQEQLRSPQTVPSYPHPPNRGPQGMVNQKPPPSPSMPLQQGTQAKPVVVEIEESDDRVLGKRSIHELLQQIDPSEKLDPEVEDILADIAEDFVESITTFGCSLAKHRKSDTLEAKDILLHVERNWNIRLPGFNNEEIKAFRKPVTTEIHKDRVAAVKKSITVTEAANARNQRGGQSKTPLLH